MRTEAQTILKMMTEKDIIPYEIETGEGQFSVPSEKLANQIVDTLDTLTPELRKIVALHFRNIPKGLVLNRKNTILEEINKKREGKQTYFDYTISLGQNHLTTLISNYPITEEQRNFQDSLNKTIPSSGYSA